MTSRQRALCDMLPLTQQLAQLVLSSIPTTVRQYCAS